MFSLFFRLDSRGKILYIILTLRLFEKKTTLEIYLHELANWFNCYSQHVTLVQNGQKYHGTSWLNGNVPKFLCRVLNYLEKFHVAISD